MLRVLAGGVSVLLTGDAEVEEQRDLLAAGIGEVSVLKVAHHGSALQEPSFLDAVSPAVALVSVGEGNAYGHPNASVLARLARDGARVLRTDQAGDIALTMDRGRLSVAAGGV